MARNGFGANEGLRHGGPIPPAGTLAEGPQRKGWKMTIVQDDQRAYEFACPTCNSAVGKKCTEATESGRKTVAYIHTKRQELIEKTEGAVALVFEHGSHLVYDIALNWETAQSMALEGYTIRAIADDGHMSRDEIQRLCDSETARYRDCFGKK